MASVPFPRKGQFLGTTASCYLCHRPLSSCCENEWPFYIGFHIVLFACAFLGGKALPKRQELSFWVVDSRRSVGKEIQPLYIT